MTILHNVDMLLGDDKIVTADSVEDLGIIMDRELRFSKHTGNIVACTHARANNIHMFLVPGCSNSFTCLYCLCPPSVRVWFLSFSPHISRVRLIELNQCSINSQTGYISCIICCTVNGWSLLSLDLESLCQDLLLTNKSVFGLINIDSNKFFTVRCNSITHGHSSKLFLSDSQVDIRKSFFYQCTVWKWNICLHVMTIFAALQLLSNFYLSSIWIICNDIVR